jgi:carbonic anhydrase
MLSLTQNRQTFLVGAFLCVVGLSASVAAGEHEPGPSLTPQQVLEKLQEGNARYVAGKSLHGNLDAARREETVKNGQHPMATVLSCSDSRVPVELVFDQGIGDVFVVRVAGNMCNVDEAGSIEYGVDHVGTPLLVILGHSDCGAVKAAATHAKLHGHVVPLVANLRPVIARLEKEHPDLHGIELVPAAVEANVRASIDNLLKMSPIVHERVKSGKLQIVGAVYDLKSGKVRWLDEKP